MRWLLRSKIHRATVTETRLDYEGSITIDEELVERAGLWVGEKVTYFVSILYVFADMWKRRATPG